MQFYSSVSNYRGEGVAVRHPSHYRCREASYKARKCFMQIILLSHRCCYQRVYKAAHILYHSYSCATMWCNYGKKSWDRAGEQKMRGKGNFGWCLICCSTFGDDWWVNKFFSLTLYYFSYLYGWLIKKTEYWMKCIIILIRTNLRSFLSMQYVCN